MNEILPPPLFGEHVDSTFEIEIVELIVEFREGRHPRRGKVYRTLIDDRALDFHHEHVPVTEMLRHVGKDAAGGWVLFELLNGHEVRLEADHVVHLRRHGLERFITRRDLVTIEVNEIAKEVRPGRWLVGQLKAVVGVPPDKALKEICADGSFKDLKDDGHVEIRGGEKFLSHARRGGSS